ncbi:MAG: hypothetical protein ACRDD9_05170 [Shewanella sp.]
MQTLLNKLEQQQVLTTQEIIQLLNIDVTSSDFYDLLGRANTYARAHFKNQGKVFAQIGIDTRKCSGNCKFCALAKDSFVHKGYIEKDLSEILDGAQQLISDGASELFLMTTADYPVSRYLEIASRVKSALPSHIRLIGNIGDFDLDVATQLKTAGFSGMYHICRLREGVDTDIPLETRVQTLEAIQAAGLELYYCVEPIGKEHTYEEIAQEILRATHYPVTVMAAMRRVGVPGTPLGDQGEISSAELAKIVAIALLVVRPKHAMGVHEPIEMCLIAGANQIYAEVGTNPRDQAKDTEKNRGFSVTAAKQMLQQAAWEVNN